MKQSIRKKAGMSFVEAIIAMAIFSIGMAGFTFLFSSVWKNNAYTYELGQASMSASQGVTTMVGYLRKARQGDDGAYPIKSASANDLVFFSDYDRNGITERLHFYKNGTQLMMGYREPSTGLPKTYADGDQATILIADNVVNGDAVPLFYYYNNDYPNNQTGLTSVWDIRLIKILVDVNIEKGAPADKVEIRSFVELRNLNDYNRLTS